MSKRRAPVRFCPLVIFLAASILLASDSFAQSQPSTTPVVPRMYDSTKEVVRNGTISQVITRPKAGLPLGLHLIVATAQGELDVHLGPYYGRIAAQKGLVPGASIQVTGVDTHFSAGDVFLARTVVTGGQSLTIRSTNGIPVRPAQASTRTVRGSQSAGGQ